MSVQASNGEWVPLIFIESENHATTAQHDMRKLCALACPLAVLITVIEWSPAVFDSRARRDDLLLEWGNVIKAHNEVWPRPGIIGIHVGEWEGDNHLRFYSLAFATNGTICVPESIVLDRLVSP